MCFAFLWHSFRVFQKCAFFAQAFDFFFQHFFFAFLSFFPINFGSVAPQTLPPKTVAVMVDAFDVLFARGEAPMMEAYRRLNADVVVGPHPAVPRSSESPRQAYPSSRSGVSFLSRGPSQGIMKERCTGWRRGVSLPLLDQGLTPLLPAFTSNHTQPRGPVAGTFFHPSAPRHAGPPTGFNEMKLGSAQHIWGGPKSFWLKAPTFFL